MKLIDLIKNHSIFPRFERLFPEMVETAKEVDVVEWKEEYQIADRNAEILDTLEFYEKLLNEGKITEEEYEKKKKELLDQTQGIISRTEGIAFIEERQVSFRSKEPNISIVLHELGHIHFGEVDAIWSSTYGGGEMLMQLALWKGYTTSVELIETYHKWLHKAYESPENLSKELSTKIKATLNFECYPHLYALQLFSGSIPNDFMKQASKLKLEHLLYDLTSSDWEKIKVSTSGVLFFLANLLEGLKWEDSFCFQYAKALELIKTCPTCKNFICICDSKFL